jgi:hypothetical protein
MKPVILSKDFPNFIAADAVEGLALAPTVNDFHSVFCS